MKLLLDTQAFLWAILEDPHLSKTAKKLFLSQENQLFISLASIWEMAIKVSIGKLELKQSLQPFLLEQLAQNQISILNIAFRHIMKVTTLSFNHRDPFDRLLIAQAQVENLPVLSNDTVFDSYTIKRIW